jgi:hypothetical protein
MKTVKIAVKYALSISKKLLYHLTPNDTIELSAIITEMHRDERQFPINQVPTRYGTVAKEIFDLLTLSPNPIPSINPEPDNQNLGQNRPHRREKTQIWSPYEYMRLIAAIMKFGLKNWSTVAMYIGSNRNRSQCSQRWKRCLDPDISKDAWTADEEARLLELVHQHGTQCWAKMADLMISRCDVQCRYKFRQHELSQKRSQQNHQVHSTPTEPFSFHHIPNTDPTRLPSIRDLLKSSPNQSLQVPENTTLPHLPPTQKALDDFIRNLQAKPFRFGRA